MGGSLARRAVLAAAVVVAAACACRGKSKMTTVKGKAANAKMGAVVVSAQGVHFIDGLDEWPEEFEGKTVEATGRLEVVHHPQQDPALPSTAMEGPQQILKRARWKLVE